MERTIDALGSGLGNAIGWLAEHGVLLAMFAVLWLAFGIAIAVTDGGLDRAWATIQALPGAVQVLLWILFLPVMAGLWIWETGWPLLVRLVLVIGVAGWNLLVFLPKGLRVAQR
jgi:hypothetical protein